MDMRYLIAAFLVLTGCHQITVEDVTDACIAQCEVRGGVDCAGPECRIWAETYSDCLPEAYALAECMPGDCTAESDELYTCACVNDGRTDC